jgi:hypothetical protein
LPRFDWLCSGSTAAMTCRDNSLSGSWLRDLDREIILMQAPGYSPRITGSQEVMPGHKPATWTNENFADTREVDFGEVTTCPGGSCVEPIRFRSYYIHVCALPIVATEAWPRKLAGSTALRQCGVTIYMYGRTGRELVPRGTFVRTNTSDERHLLP